MASTRSSDSGDMWTGPLNGWSSEMMTTRPNVRRIVKIVVIASECIGTGEEQREADGETGARKERDPDDVGHESGRQVKAHTSRQGQVVELGEDLRHVGSASGARPIERHGRAVECIQRVRRLGVL